MTLANVLSLAFTLALVLVIGGLWGYALVMAYVANHLLGRFERYAYWDAVQERIAMRPGLVRWLLKPVHRLVTTDQGVTP